MSENAKNWGWYFPARYSHREPWKERLVKRKMADFYRKWGDIPWFPSP